MGCRRCAGVVQDILLTRNLLIDSARAVNVLDHALLSQLRILNALDLVKPRRGLLHLLICFSEVRISLPHPFCGLHLTLISIHGIQQLLAAIKVILLSLE